MLCYVIVHITLDTFKTVYAVHTMDDEEIDQYEELFLDASITTAGAIIAAANEVMGLPTTGTLPQQVAALYSAIWPVVG